MPDPGQPHDDALNVPATTSVPIDLSSYRLSANPDVDLESKHGAPRRDAEEPETPAGELHTAADGTPFYADYEGFYAGLATPTPKKVAAPPAASYARTPTSSLAQPLQPTNALAIVALVLSLIGGSLLAVILGHVALSQIRRTGERGEGMAKVALVIGYISLVTAAIILIVIVVSGLSANSLAGD